MLPAIITVIHFILMAAHPLSREKHTRIQENR
jgi:Na+/melibiose symporter-like transporter